MSTPSTGELRKLATGYAARIRIEGKHRKDFALLTVGGDETAARQRCTAMAEIAVRLRRAGFTDKIEELLKMAATSRAGRSWESVLSAVDTLTAGQASPLSASARVTVADFGKEWRSGDLTRRFPDRVPAIDHTRNGQIARLYVDPLIGDRTVVSITLDDADVVMSKIPAGRSASQRRHVAQYVGRLLRLAVYPGRLCTVSPIPKGWLPDAKSKKAKECLYPDEDATLLACTAVPLVRRIAYGFLDREGMRTDELSRLTLADIDLVRGRVTLDENKTDDPRDWDLDPGVHRALVAWRKRLPKDAPPSTQVFVADGVPLNVAHLAADLRADLKRAGITRPQLFERSATRRPIRAHDLRATFVTVALATGKTETWVADRTGHTTSQMINTYRRKARGWALGPLSPLDEAIPELRGVPHQRPATPPTEAISWDRDTTKAPQTRATGNSREARSVLGSAAARHTSSSPLPCTTLRLLVTGLRALGGEERAVSATDDSPTIQRSPSEQRRASVGNETVRSPATGAPVARDGRRIPSMRRRVRELPETAVLSSRLPQGVEHRL
jgi:integrase